MEKNNLNNKLEKQTEKQFKDLKNGLTSLSGMFETAIDEAYSSLDSVLDKKQAAKYKAFNDKYIKLSMNGQHVEAEELKKKFSEQF